MIIIQNPSRFSPIAGRKTQFYNENTGETTWDQPVPSPEETRDEQGSASGRIGHLLPRDQPREMSSTHKNHSRSRGIPTSRRGWLGLGRGAAKTQRQGEAPHRLETRGTARKPTGMNDYGPTRNLDARGPPPREWPSDRRGKDMMSPQQRSREGGPEGPDSRFGDGRLPVYDLQQEMPGSATNAWRGEEGGVLAQPWDDYAEHVKVQPSGTADRTVEGGADRDRQTRDGNEPPAAALFTGHTTGHPPGALEGSDLEGVGPAVGVTGASRSGDSEWWTGGTTAIGAAVTDDAEPQAGNVGGLQGDTGTTTGQVGTTAERSHNETTVTLERGQETDSMGTGTQEPQVKPQTTSAEGSGEGTAPLHVTTTITETEQAAAGAGEQMSALIAKEKSPRGSGLCNEVSTPWAPEMTHADALSGRQQGRSSAPEGEHHMEATQALSGNVGGYYPTEAWSAGKPSTTHGQDESLWGDGFQPQEHPEGGKGSRKDARGWDWSDPWGQEGAWGAPGG